MHLLPTINQHCSFPPFQVLNWLYGAVLLPAALDSTWYACSAALLCPLMPRKCPSYRVFLFVQKYYPWTTSYIQQPGFACVSTPTRARNQPAVTDFLDIGQYTRENVYLTGLGGDDKFAINSQSFMARGYSLWRVLRRMEMENVDSQHLGWMTYVMHIEARQATLAASSTHAPITSVLVPTHSPTVLSTVLDRQAEGFDVAQIFDRERAFLSWNLHNPMRAMHDSARIAVVFEIVLVVVLFVTLLGNIAPWCDTRNHCLHA